MTEKAILDVLRLQRFTQKWIRAKINHSYGEIIAGAPVGVNFIQFVGR
jgi:hypothetical protein